MRIKEIEVFLNLKKSQKNLDGGWTTGEENVKWVAALDPGENAVEMTHKLAQIIKNYLLMEFGIRPEVTLGELVGDKSTVLVDWRPEDKKK